MGTRAHGEKQWAIPHWGQPHLCSAGRWRELGRSNSPRRPREGARLLGGRDGLAKMHRRASGGESPEAETYRRDHGKERARGVSNHVRILDSLPKECSLNLGPNVAEF